jgi:hypothetical protein
MAQTGGGIAISGLPAINGLASLNATYAPTGQLVAGFPSFSAGPRMHLFRHPEDDAWRLDPKPFDPETTACAAWIPAAAGHVPTGARAWMVALGGGNWGEHEVTAREVDAAAAAAEEAERAAAVAAQGKRVVPPPPRRAPSAARTVSSACTAAAPAP